jgi:hypothetical protein
MKSYKYSTKERAERVAKTLGCSGSHYHNEDGERKYMPCKSHEIFKSKTKKDNKSKEEEVTELIDFDGTWKTSNVPILDPASTGVGTKTTDQIAAATKTPRDVFMRGGVSFRGESVMSEEDMEKSFGFDGTKFMDYKETVNYYQDELGLDKEAAEERAIQQGKKPNLQKRTPKKIKKKKNFIDRLILKEKGIDENEDIIEDVLLDKEKNNDNINPILLKNVNSIKRMAKKQGISIQKLITLIKNEQ